MAIDIFVDLKETILNGVKESMTGLAPEIKQYIANEIKQGTSGTYKSGKINIDFTKSINNAIKTESKNLKGIDLSKLMFMDNKNLSKELQSVREIAERDGEKLDSKKYLITSRLLEKRGVANYNETDIKRISDTEEYLKTLGVNPSTLYQEFDNIYNSVVNYAKNLLTSFSNKDLSGLSMKQLNSYLEQTNDLSWILDYGKDNKELYSNVQQRFIDATSVKEENALKTIDNVAKLFDSGKMSSSSLEGLENQLSTLKSAQIDLKDTGFGYDKEIANAENLISKTKDLIAIRKQSESTATKTTEETKSAFSATQTQTTADSKTTQSANQTATAIQKEGDVSEQVAGQFNTLATAKNDVASKNTEVAQTANTTATNLSSEGKASEQVASSMSKVGEASENQKNPYIRPDVRALAEIRKDIISKEGTLSTLGDENKNQIDSTIDYIKKKESDAQEIEDKLGSLNKYEQAYLDSKVKDAELLSDVSYGKYYDKQSETYAKNKEQAQKILNDAKNSLSKAQTNNPNATQGNVAQLQNQIEGFDFSTSKDPIADAKKYSDAVISETKRMEDEQSNYNKNFNEYVTARSNIIKLSEQKKSVTKDGAEYKELSKQIEEQKSIRDEAKKQIGTLSKEQHNQIKSDEKALKDSYALKNAKKSDSQTESDTKIRMRLEEQANTIVAKAKSQLEESVAKTQNVKDGKTNSILSSIENFDSSTSKDPVAKANKISDSVSSELQRRATEQSQYNSKLKEYVELQSKIKNVSLEKSTATEGSEYFKTLETELSNLIKQSDMLKKSLGEIPTSALSEIDKNATAIQTAFDKKQAKATDKVTKIEENKAIQETGTTANNEQIKKYSELASKSSSFYQSLFSMQQQSVNNISTETSQLDALIAEYQQIKGLNGDYSSLINTNGTKSSQSRVASSVDKFVNNMDISNGREVLYSNLMSTAQRQVDFTDSSTYIDSYIQKINESIAKTDELKNKIIAVDSTDGFKKVTSDLLVYNKEVAKLTSDASDNKIATSTQIGNLQQAISRTLSQNTKMSSEMKNSYEGMLTRLNTSEQLSTGQVKALNAEFLKLNSTLYTTGQTGLSFFDTFGSHLKSVNAQLVAQFFSVQAFINYGKQAFNVIREIDTAMTELKRIATLTDYGYSQIFQDATEAAQSYGREISNIINASADWVRLGFSTDDAVDLAGISSMYQNVTDLDEDTAVDNLVTAYKGFEEQLLATNNNDKTEAITKIVDVYDKLGKICP